MYGWQQNTGIARQQRPQKMQPRGYGQPQQRQQKAPAQPQFQPRYTGGSPMPQQTFGAGPVRPSYINPAQSAQYDALPQSEKDKYMAGDSNRSGMRQGGDPNENPLDSVRQTVAAMRSGQVENQRMSTSVMPQEQPAQQQANPNPSAPPPGSSAYDFQQHMQGGALQRATRTLGMQPQDQPIRPQQFGGENYLRSAPPMQRPAPVQQAQPEYYGPPEMRDMYLRNSGI